MAVQDLEKPKKKFGVYHAILVFVILFFLLVIIVSLTSDNGNNNYSASISKNQNETFDDLDAYIQGQYYVKQVLKSPATVKFPPTDFLVHRLNDNRFEVVSYVDSQNSFGAMLRSSWNVVFKYQGGKTYLEKIVVNGKVVYSK